MDFGHQVTLTDSTTSFSLILVIGSGLFSWLIYGILYRLFWSPVAHIPGPKLAALTFWYEFYYDVVKAGQYSFKIKSLHEQYGPIIRINPYEVHINDPEFYDQVYVSAASRKTDKWWWSANMFTNTNSVLSTEPHALHRRRRAVFSNFFSMSAVHRLQPLLRDKIDIFLNRLDQAAQTQEPISLTKAFAALTIDIISAYSFSESYDHLSAPDFSPQFHDANMRLSLASHVSKQFPWLFVAVQYIPQSISKRLFPDQACLIDMRTDFQRQVRQVKQKRATESLHDGGEEKSEQARTAPTFNHSIFYSMIDDNLPEAEKSDQRLTSEALTIIVAGTITTAHTLETITYHLLMNTKIRALLTDELSAAKETITSTKVNGRPLAETTELGLNKLESLPYLTAVIREGLRMGSSVPHRLQRVSPTVPLHYHDYVIPPGTPVSMSSVMMHNDSSVFPEPDVFKPERWLPLETTGHQLNKYLVPFSKGTRQCVGMNLAMSELYLTIAAVFGKERELKLYDTVFERDLALGRDGFNSLPSPQSKGVRVIVEDVGEGIGQD